MGRQKEIAGLIFTFDGFSGESEKARRIAVPSEKDGCIVPAPWLTAGDAARYLGVARKTVYRLIETGEIKAVKSKGTTLIERDSLDAFRSRGSLT